MKQIESRKAKALSWVNEIKYKPFSGRQTSCKIRQSIYENEPKTDWFKQRQSSSRPSETWKHILFALNMHRDRAEMELNQLAV